jgi:nucleotide-binding universal stress UspA family protein
MKILAALYNKEEDEAVARFAQMIAGMTGGEVIVSYHPSADRLLRRTREGHFDLIILHWLGDPQSDQIVQRVVAGTAVSVLVMKDEPAEFNHVLVCSGGRPIAEPVVKAGAHLASAAAADVTLLHVTPQVPTMYTGMGAMDHGIEDLLSRDTLEARHLRHSARIFEDHGVKATLELRHGVVVDEIIRAVQVNTYDLLVLGASNAASRLNRPLIRPFFEKVTSKIITHAPCSVLVVRAGTLDRLEN